MKDHTLLNKRWTDAEIETLREIYPCKDKEYILLVINRTWSRIQGKANELKIKRKNVGFSRFEKSIDKQECWEWKGKLDRYGYGRITINRKFWLAHRYSYTHFNGPIPENMVLDHLCRNRACVNPDHLRAVTQKQNVLENSNSIFANNLKKTFCLNGHKLPEIRKYGRRVCEICSRHKRLYKEINIWVDRGMIDKHTHPTLSLELFKYSRQCVKNECWFTNTKLARGLVFDSVNKVIIGKGFAKFFNIGEFQSLVPEKLPWDLGFSVEEKLDGSLVYIWNFDNEWHTSTSGSFVSEQAMRVKNIIKTLDLSLIDRNITLLVEYTSPENQIVVSYDNENITLLSAFNRDDLTEFNDDKITTIARKLNLKRPAVFNFQNKEEILNYIFPSNFEGFIVKFENGFRVKLKSPLYVKVHRLLNYLSPKGVIELIMGHEYRTTIEGLPKSIQCQFDDIRSKVLEVYTTIDARTDVLLERLRKELSQGSRREVAGWIQAQAERSDWPIMFAKLDKKEFKHIIWKNILNNEN